MTKVLDGWTREGASTEDPNHSILAKHADLAAQAREHFGIRGARPYVAYRWTGLTSLPIFGSDGAIEPSDNEPEAMKVRRRPGVPVPPEDYAEVIAATGYTPEDPHWQLFIFVPVY